MFVTIVIFDKNNKFVNFAISNDTAKFKLMEDLINSLEILGFTGYESKVFCILFEGSSMTATEVAKQSKIPRASAYNIFV